MKKIELTIAIMAGMFVGLTACQKSPVHDALDLLDEAIDFVNNN